MLGMFGGECGHAAILPRAPEIVTVSYVSINISNLLTENHIISIPNRLPLA